MAIISLRSLVISLALYFSVMSTVLGAAVKQESQDQATNTASDDPSLYHDKCVRGYCQWQCNDNSDWCWVGTFFTGKSANKDPEWVTCSSDKECTTKVDGMKRQIQTNCRSVVGASHSLADLKCVAKSLEQTYREAAEEDRKQVEAWRKDQERQRKEEAARLKKVEEKLGQGGIEAIAARLANDVRGENQLARARELVTHEAKFLRDDDLKLAPEALKERLFNLAKESLKTQEELTSIFPPSTGFEDGSD